MVVDRDNMVRKHHPLMTSMLHIPDHSIIASFDDTDVVTEVHWNLSICAQVPVQRSVVPTQAQVTVLIHLDLLQLSLHEA